MDNSNPKTEHPAGFVAGTLVHTREGLQPIEQISAGDYVLSKPENGVGEATYKRVAQTTSRDAEAVYFLSYGIANPDELSVKSKYEHLVATGDHRIWVRKMIDRYKDSENDSTHSVNGWVSIHELHQEAWNRLHDELSMPLLAELELQNGRSVLLEFRDPLLRMTNPDQGVVFKGGEYWHEQISGVSVLLTPQGPRVEREAGESFEQATMDVEEDLGEEFDEESVVYRSGGYHQMRRQVFNLEIEDNHTYYVGEAGVLVHT